MEVTFGPFYTCFLVTFFLAGYLHIIIHRSSFFQEHTIKFLMIGMLIILIRMAIPINFPFTYTIYSYKLLPKLIDFTTTHIANSHLRVADFMCIIWLTVALVLLIQLIIQYIQLLHYLSQFYIEDNAKNAHLFELLRRCYEKPMQVAVVPELISPAVTGLRKPILILPNIKSFSDKELEYIILHETAHYKNNHLWLGLMMEIFCRIHWWNPFVQYVKKEFSLFLELSNDFFLIQANPKFNVVNYADLIVKTARKIHSSKNIVPTPMMNFAINNPSVLNSRIHFILDNQPPSSKRLQTILCSGLIFVAVFLSVFIVPDARFPDNPTETNGAVEITEDNAYILETEDGYSIYVYEKYYGDIDHIPDDLKNIPIHMKGDSNDEK